MSNPDTEQFVRQRDFSTFYPTDDPRYLANGLLFDIAAGLGKDIHGDSPDPQALYNLTGAIGKNKVLRDNQPVTVWTPAAAAELADRSNIHAQLDRSLWTPELAVPDGSERGLIVIQTGATANLMGRMASWIVKHPMPGATMIVATGTRVMDTDTETPNPNVKAFYKRKGRYPNETEFATEYVVAPLKEAGNRVFHLPFDTDDGKEIAKGIVDARPDILTADVVAARAAVAAGQLAFQLLEAALRKDPGFDKQSDPQLYMLSDQTILATTEDETHKPAEFQSPIPALRMVGTLGRLIARIGRTRA